MKVINDINVEDHFEELLISLSISSEVDPAFPAAISKNGNATIQIYDLGEGTILKKTTFAVAGGALDYLWGWGVEGNGLSGPTWLDDKGLYSVDQYFSGSQMMRDEYYEDARLFTYKSSNTATDGIIGNTCASENEALIGKNSSGASNVTTTSIHTDITGGHIASGSKLVTRSSTVTNFPSNEITISAWVRTTDTTAPGIIFSFMSDNKTVNKNYTNYEFILYDARNLKTIVQTYLPTIQEMKNPHMRDVNEEFVSGESVNDGEWRFISVTWNSALVASSTDAFEQTTRGKKLENVGNIRVGGALNDPKFPFTGDIQNIQIWNKALKLENILKSMQWPIGIDQRSVLRELLYFWRFSTEEVDIVKNKNLIVGKNIASYISSINPSGNNSASHSMYDLVGHRSTGLSYTYRKDNEVPCAEDVQWYFSAPVIYSGNLQAAYNGRLEFFLRSPDHSGSPRSMMRFIMINGGTGAKKTTIYNNLKKFPVPSMTKWTSYVVVLREDFGWTDGNNAPLSFADMWDVLSNVQKISIRGDNWLCSYSGDGSEAVTIQNVTLYKIQQEYNYTDS